MTSSLLMRDYPMRDRSMRASSTFEAPRGDRPAGAAVPSARAAVGRPAENPNGPLAVDRAADRAANSTVDSAANSAVDAPSDPAIDRNPADGAATDGAAADPADPDRSGDRRAAAEGALERSRVSPWLSALAYPLGCRVLLPAYFGEIRVSGRDRLPRQGPVVLAPTHRARWDALMVPYAAGRPITGRDVHFMVSANETLGLQGWFVRRLGGFPVDPTKPGIASLRHGIQLLEAGRVLTVFPEGNIYRDGRVHPLKPGLARLAVQAETNRPGLGVQVVPMHLEYGSPVPSWGCGASIAIGEPLAVADRCVGRSPKEAARALTSDLAAALEALGNGEPGDR